MLRLVLGDRFDSSGWLVAGLTVTAACLGMLTVTGTALIGLSRQGWSTLGWLIATVVTTVVLSTSIELERRTVIALAAGPLSGVAFHLIGIWRARRETDRRAT